MTAFTGMDITQVRQLAAQLNQAAGEIRTLRDRLTSQMGNTAWVGSDRTQFESDWNGQYATSLAQVADALETASGAATRNAAEQEQTSAH